MDIVSIIQFLDNEFGQEWISSSEPETIVLAIEENPQFKEFKITDIEFDMIQALRTIARNDSAWIDPFVFENIVDALNGNGIIPEEITMPSIYEIAYTFDILKSIEPDKEFHPNVYKYIASAAYNDGIAFLPYPLDKANEFLSGLLSEEEIRQLKKRLLEEEKGEDKIGIMAEKISTIIDLFQ